MDNNSCALSGVVALRNKLIAVDEVTGALEAWHPSANTALGTFAVGSGGGYLAVGGSFNKIAGQAQQGFGEFKE